MKVATAQQIKNIDFNVINDYGISGIILMENAAINSVNIICETLDVCKKSCLVICGKGNNGGDGFAIARHLLNRGARVRIGFWHDTNLLKGDALVNYNILKNLEIPIIGEITDILEELKYCAFVIDSLFGFGFKGVLSGNDKIVADAVNASGKYVFAIDMPSGICADSGTVSGTAIKANKTITFTTYKPAQLIFPAAEYCGEVIVSNIGVPNKVIVDQNIIMSTIGIDDVVNQLNIRNQNTHKGDYGKAFIVAGSRGMSGAAYMSGNSCAKTGAGLVKIGVPSCINDIIEVKTTEAMSLPLADCDGKLSLKAYETILDECTKSDALLFGPGLSRSGDIETILSNLIENIDIPMIIDADGLNALSNDVSILNNHKQDIILTPHNGEMARLTDNTIEFIEENRVDVARQFAIKYNVVLILKGPHTIVVTPSGEIYFNMTGNAGMATGGSGDVLAGMILAFLSRKVSAVDAAKTAVYLHGMAGDIANDKLGEESMLAGDIMDCIANAIKSVKKKFFLI